MQRHMTGAWKRAALNGALILLSVTSLAAISETTRAEQIIRPPEPEVMATTAPAEIVTGVCTFGDCPVNLSTPSKTLQEDCKVETSQDLAETSQPAVTEDSSAVEPDWDDVINYEVNEINYSGGYTVTCWVTAYCGCWECSGEYGPYDVFGNRCIPNHTIGVDPSVIPYGTQVEINGIVYTASDTGSAINGYEIDIYHETHAECEAWPTGYYEVTIY